jgi:hypothetical protein
MPRATAFAVVSPFAKANALNPSLSFHFSLHSFALPCVACEAAKHDTGSAKGCAFATTVVQNETQLGFIAQVAIDGAGSATRSLTPSQDEWMACDLDTEFMHAACKWLFAYRIATQKSTMQWRSGSVVPRRNVVY